MDASEWNGGNAQKTRREGKKLTEAIRFVRVGQRLTPREARPFIDLTDTAATFDKNGRIQLDFGREDTKYDLKAIQERTRTLLSFKIPASGSVDEQVPLMNICIMIVGTRGDVQPFVGIAKRLQQGGHRVRLATHAVYRDFVMEHGIEFYPLGGDPKELAAYMVKTGGHIIPLKLDTLIKDVPRNVQMIEEILNSTWPAVSAADLDANGKGIPGRPFQANAIISNPVTYGHIHVAERLGVPLHIMFPQPWVPTTAFPHPMANLTYDGKPHKRNYISYKLVDFLMWKGTDSMVNQFRGDVLGLPKIRKGGWGQDILLDLAIPHAFMWSPALVPKPHDWGHIYDVIGTVQLKGVGSTYNPTPELERFLGNDGGPIFVGFGSMILSDPAKTTKMIIEAATQANVRVLIQSSWSDMAGDIKVPSNVFFLGNCPHDWLMPRVSAVVHHGGAGTTAAGLLAGKPTFIVPFFGDQPFWGRAVVKAGVGVEPCPIGELTTEKLRAAFSHLMDPEVRKRAEAMRDVMAREDGVEEAVKSFYRHLPLKHMKCDVDGERLATKWSTKDKIKLCDECEFVISSRPENSLDDIILYHCVDYSARGPDTLLKGAASGTGALIHEVEKGWKDIILRPVKGFRRAGVKGAVVALVRSVFSAVFFRPIYGAALLADHLATGGYNQKRRENERKRGTMFGNKRLLVAVGQTTTPDAHVAGMRPDETSGEGLFKTVRDRVLVQLAQDERHRLVQRFFELNGNRSVVRRPFDSEPLEVAPTPVASPRGEHKEMKHSPEMSDKELSGLRDLADIENRLLMEKLERIGGKTIPKMNICLLATGTWDDDVQQFVAVALRLKADSHRVRVASHECYRDRITGVGLEYFPLAGSSGTVHSIVGHIEVRDPLEQEHDAAVRLFVEESKTPVIFAGFQVEGFSRDQVDKLVQDVAHAAGEANCRVILQLVDQSSQEPLHRSAVLFQIPSDASIHSVLPCVTAAIHWGRASVTSACLAAGVPACVIARNPFQRFWGHAVARVGAGIEPLDATQLSPQTLVQALQALQYPHVRDKTHQLSSNVVSSNDVIEKTVQSFYANLPLEAMTCDLDPTRIARIYDQANELKLSYEAQLVVQSLTDPDDRTDLKYKPLKYAPSKPPRYSLRRLSVTSLVSQPSGSNLPRLIYADRFDHLLSSASPMFKTALLGARLAIAERVVEAPAPWTSPDVAAQRRDAINAQYEALLASRSLR
ncbi:hypothetical protein Poli38472_004594 [Pythium oligandrum]|uniref:Sterol 3-beta-glucosyltransferase n=1 Tax=Pythium oligandrum TaxID=41045 RepID=A0A8K1CB19_PYTOL|nr:hypothetical protein Poli38472_004594 [Pythium oligandrum]|eukprot:TMW59525.1 hypothetical protein Poli38472_004594 [Pythium oligandrum]